EAFWEKGESFLMFLQRNSLPLSLYYNLDPEDKEFASEVYAGVKYYTLKNDDGDVKQILIPVSSELQIHIYREKDDSYTLTLTPTAYIQETKELAFDMQISPYQDIRDLTGSGLIAGVFSHVFKGSFDATRLQKGTNVALIYNEKKRLGTYVEMPKIHGAYIDIRGKKEYIFLYDDRYYNQDGKEMESFFLTVPLRYLRISSPFSLKRWHPVLGKYRAHLGIDYAAPIGTIVNAAGDGKVDFVGTKNGYGKTVEIVHQGGYKTLYAHLNGFRNSLKKGQSVKQGQHIAFVGNTGISTGPHLHFGLYKGNQAINPSSVLHVAKSELTNEQKKMFFDYIKDVKDNLEVVNEKRLLPLKEVKFDLVASLYEDDDNENNNDDVVEENE
ncbi:MAG: peptidoglycan DD-metalloendopeptidase family protein, partial [Campylobacteraceae bacterium]|nr:peptidoglycan DD-metalloendopeptidase family protein [Campylobacteraceae bacterium]